jgi:hypothetical protein
MQNLRHSVSQWTTCLKLLIFLLKRSQLLLFEKGGSCEMIEMFVASQLDGGYWETENESASTVIRIVTAIVTVVIEGIFYIDAHQEDARI